MKISVKASSIDGHLIANPSKSVMQRAIALAALYRMDISLLNPCLSDDSMAALSVARAMGCKIDYSRNAVRIKPGRAIASNSWRIGESGFSARVFAIMATLFKRDITISGEGSILKRSMNNLEQVLVQMGVKVESSSSFLPISIRGPVSHFDLDFDGSGGSQVLSALLMCLPAAKKNSQVTVSKLYSKPYVDMTLDMMQKFGFKIERNGYRQFKIKGKQKSKIKSFSVEGDWSGAAFILVAAAIGGSVSLEALNTESFQGDKKILQVLRKAGAKVVKKKQLINVEHHELKAFEYDASDTPDLVPPLATLAAFCKGTSRIKGVGRLKNKESNRYKSIKKEFVKLGVELSREKDWILIKGVKQVNGGRVESHNDHRIAMALAVLGLRASKKVQIDGFECTSKSYPGFLRDMKRLGANYKVLDE